MLLFPILFYFIFKILPLSGLILAFRRYVPAGSPYGVSWEGLRFFKLFLGNDLFWRAFRNNIVLSGLTLLTVPIPAIFALLLNEIDNIGFKKLTQTVSYLPRFMSIVVIAGIIRELLSPSTGVINQLLELLGFEKIFFLMEPQWFRPMFVLSHIWQWTGFGAIIYLARISNIDPQLYESALTDGANRWQQTLYITIPGIMPVFVIMLILNIGRVLELNFQKVLLLETPLTYETAEVIQTFVFRVGIQQGNISMATAVGFTESIIAVLMMLSANWLADKFGQNALF
jgi:putative aldouronate transport system permease protein